MRESVILCEGYHDRAFWAGWLEHLDCLNLGQRPAGGRAIRVSDPWGERVRNGDFAFRSLSNNFVRIKPCHGRDNIRPTAEFRLKGRLDKELTRLVLCTDLDMVVGGATEVATAMNQQSIEDLLRRSGDFSQSDHGEFVLDGGATVVCLIRWEAGDGAVPGLPSQQTLERLVCAALVAAYAERGPAVQGWLDGRPEPAPQAGPKEFAWSHMAGWFAPLGCDTFYRKLWLDPRIAEEMKTRLAACGAWRVAEALAQ